MLCYSVSVVFLLSLSSVRSDPRTSTRRYKPVIQVTEEIDINDITFTTSAPDAAAAAYYSPKVAYARVPEPSPSGFTHGGYKDSYGVPVDKSYASGQPLQAALVKYKPYKVLKVQETFRPVVYKPRGQEKSKLSFEPPTTYSAPEPSKYAAKLVAFPSQLPSKAPTRASSFLAQDKKNFIPSPTFSPSVLAQINSETPHKFTDSSDVTPFTTQKILDWPKPTKKPYHIKKPKQIPDNHNHKPLTEDFPALEDTPHTSNPLRDSPQISESLLSEISTAHKGGSSAANNLDEVAESLDLKTGERVEFQMYGMDGPKSYKFGFDTGKGENRHFRFEERDNTGKVKGHYGYLDEDGKMRIMKYEADPITGFHAGPVEISPDDN